MAAKGPHLSPLQWDAIRQCYEFDSDEPTLAVSAARGAAKLGFSPPSRMAVSKRSRKAGWERRGPLAGINRAAHRRADRIMSLDEIDQVHIHLANSLGDVPVVVPDSATQAAALVVLMAQAPERGGSSDDDPDRDDDPDARDDDTDRDDDDPEEGAGEKDAQEHGEPEDARAPAPIPSATPTLAAPPTPREQSEDLRAEVIARHRQEWRQIAALRQEAVKMRHIDFLKASNYGRFAKTMAEITTLQQAGERKAWGLDDLVLPNLEKRSDADLIAIMEGRRLY